MDHPRAGPPNQRLRPAHSRESIGDSSPPQEFWRKVLFRVDALAPESHRIDRGLVLQAVEAPVDSLIKESFWANLNPNQGFGLCKGRTDPSPKAKLAPPVCRLLKLLLAEVCGTMELSGVVAAPYTPK